jgi:hypothetical protein
VGIHVHPVTRCEKDDVWVGLRGNAPLAVCGEDQIDTIELGQRLKPLPSRRPGAPGIPRSCRAHIAATVRLLGLLLPSPSV